MRLYQVTCITLDFVLFKGGWYILILPVGTRFFDILRIEFFRRSSLLRVAFPTHSKSVWDTTHSFPI